MENQSNFPLYYKIFLLHKHTLKLKMPSFVVVCEAHKAHIYAIH